MSKKDKKKAKKAKRASVVDTEQLEPVTPLEASTDITERPDVEGPPTQAADPPASATVGALVEAKQETIARSPALPVEAVPDDRPPPAPVEVPEPVTSVEVQESAMDESALLSKAQKKKAKKAKRSSTVDGETSQPSTPAEEVVKELAPEAAPSTLPATNEPKLAQMLDDEADAWTGAASIKKNKKKNQKQQKQTAIDPFLADEATRAANVSEPQPSPSPPLTSETPLTFSGIPAQYPQTNTDGSVGIADTSAHGLDDTMSVSKDVDVVEEKEFSADGERDVTLLDAAIEQQETEKEQDKMEELTGEAAIAEPSVRVHPTESASVAQPEPLAEPSALVPVDHPQAPTVEEVRAEPEALTSNIVLAEDKKDATDEPASIVVAQIEPTKEKDVDTTTQSTTKKKNKKSKRTSASEEPIIEPEEAVLKPGASVNDDHAQLATDDQIAEQVTASAGAPKDTSKPAAMTDNMNEQLVTEPRTIDLVTIDLPATEHTTDDASRVVVASTELPVPESLLEETTILPTKKDKKKGKKSKRQSGTATPLPEIESSIPIESLDTLTTPQIEGAQAILESHMQPEVPASINAEVKEQLPTAEPAVDVAEDIQESAATAEDQQLAPVPVSKATIEPHVQNLQSVDATPEQVTDEPALSKKGKKKAKKAKKQSGSATPIEESLPVVEPPVEENSIAIQPETIVGGSSKDVETLAPEVVEPEQSAELTTQFEPQQEDVQSTVERDVKPTLMEAGSTAIDNQPEVDVPVETEAVPTSSKKDKKKKKKSEKQSRAATLAEEATSGVATEKVKGIIAPEIAPQAVEPIAEPLVEPVVEPVIQPVVESKDVSMDVAPVSLQESPKAEAEAIKSDVGLRVAEQIQPLDASSAPAFEPTSALVGSSQKEEIQPMPDASIEPIQSAEDDWAHTPSKKEMKKREKAKESGVEMPVTEGPLDIISHSQVQEAGSASAASIEAIEQSEVVRKDIVEDAVPQQSTVREQKLDPLPAPDAPTEAPDVAVQEKISTSVSKKDKKNAKKSKKASGTATPVAEDVPIVQQEHTQEPADTESGNIGVPMDDRAPQTNPSHLTTETEPIPVVASRDIEATPAIPPPTNIIVEQSSQTDRSKQAVQTGIETATADDDLASSTSKRSKKKNKKSVAVAGNPALVEVGATGPVFDPAVPMEGNIIAETDRVILSDAPAPAEIDTTPGAAQTTDNETIDSAVAKGEDVATGNSQDTLVQNAQQEPVSEPISVEASTPLEPSLEPAELERLVLSRELSKKEKKKAGKKSNTAATEETSVVETMASTEGPETKSAAVPSEPSPTDQDIRISPQAGLSEPEPVVEPTVESVVEPAVEPAVEPLAEPIVEPVVEQEVKDLQLPAPDTPISASIDIKAREISAENESSAEQKKSKKSKKDKKAKKQSLAPDAAEEFEDKRPETIEPASLPPSLPVEAPVIESVAVDTPLPEQTPFEREVSATIDVVNSQTVDTTQHETSETVNTPLPGPTSTEEQYVNLPADIPEVIRQSFKAAVPSAEQETLDSASALPQAEYVVEVTQEETSAPLSRKSSKKSNKGRTDKDLAENTTLASQPTLSATEESVESKLILDEIKVDPMIEDAVAQQPPPFVEPSPEVPIPDPELQNTDVGPITEQVETGAHTSGDVAQPMQVNSPPLPEASQLNWESTPAQTAPEVPIGVNAEDEQGSTPSKKAKKEKKKAKKSKGVSEDLTPAENTPPAVPEEAIAVPITIEEPAPNAMATEVVQESHVSSDLRPDAANVVPKGPFTPTEQPKAEITEPVTISSRRGIAIQPEVAETEGMPVPAEDLEGTLARSTSKKDKKKKNKGKKESDRMNETEDKSTVASTSVEEVSRTVLPEQPTMQPEVPPNTIVDESEAQKSASPIPSDIQADAETKESFSSLQAVRDEAVDLRQRSEALELALASNDRLDEPSTSQSTSMFDIVNSLSEKDKKKARKSRNSDLPEPMTPAAEPEAAVETTARVEDVAVKTDELTTVLSRQRSKDEKRKAQQLATKDVAMADVLGTDEPTKVVETKEPRMQDSEPTNLAEPILGADSIAVDVASPSREIVTEELPLPSRKLSKKDKKKQARLAAAAQEESVPETHEDVYVAPYTSPAQNNRPATIEEQERTQVVDPDIATAPLEVALPGPVNVESGPVFSDNSRELSLEDTLVPAPAAEEIDATVALTRKESKKDKKKSKKSISSLDTTVSNEQAIAPSEPVFEVPSTGLDQRIEPIDNTPSMSEVQELRQAERAIRELELDQTNQGNAQTRRNVKLDVVLPSQLLKDKDQDSKEKLSTSAKTEQTLEKTSTTVENTNVGTTQPSTPAKTFDTISEDVLPTLNKKGSKKHRLAALFEKQSPEQLREAERNLRRGGSGSVKNLAEQYESQSRSVTPLQIVTSKSISRAASDDRLRSASPRHDVDFAATVAAGLNESGFDPSYVINNPSFYRSRSTSRQEEYEVAPDDEVATARRRASVSKFGSMGRASASTSPTKETVEPIDRAIPKGIEVPLAATDVPSFDPMDVLNDPAFGRRKSPPGVLEEADPEELYASSKNKTLKGRKKRITDTAKTALSMQDSVEQTAAETPVVEASYIRPPAVEARADSTTCELGFGAPVNEPVRVLNTLEQSPKKDKSVDKITIGKTSQDGEQRGRTMVRNEPSGLPPTPKQESKPAAGIEVGEYPFPRVLTPEVRESTVRVLEEEKKDKKSRKGKERVEAVTETSLQEHHKRRAHPVSFHEEQPEEKRLHKIEAPSSNRATAANVEPLWSFNELNDGAIHATDSAMKAPTPQVKETVHEERQHPQGPRTPRKKSERDAIDRQQAEASPALPEYSTPRRFESPPTSDFVTKERTSYLFDSSPSTRAYGTSPTVAPKTPNFDSPQTNESHGKTPVDRPRQEQVSPIRASKQSESYQSVFGDPTEKEDATTPAPKRARTPGTQSLGTITENSPDDSSLLKKGRSITDVGSAERGVKSLRRTERNRSFSDRVMSPPPITPTPANRRSTPLAQEVSGRETPSRETPWHQANDPIDRSVALSPARRLPHTTPDPIKQQLAEIRDAPGVRSQQSFSNIGKLRSPETERPMSSMSMNSNASTHSLRRVEKAQSGDLRAASRLGEASALDASSVEQPNLSGIALAAGATAAVAAASKLRGEGKGRRASMAETFEAMGEAPRSPMSPTRAPSLRKRQSMQIMDLQTQLDQLAEHNKLLEVERLRAEEVFQAQQHQRQIDEQLVAEAVEARDRQIHQRDIDIAQLKDTLQRLREEIARLTELNNTLTEANRNLTNDANERYAQLQSEGQLVHQQWQTSQRELEGLRSQHDRMTRGMEDALREEIGAALDDRNAEIHRLETELSSAREQIKGLQKQILASKKPSESFLTIRDEDYFDSACQQLCQHVQQWVLRFSKFSDTRACRLSSDIQADTRLDAATREKMDKRLDNAILDGSDVDSLLADRVKRRDVFMSIVMSMIWEYVFTRYLFGMDRDQRQKLKSLEKTLSEVGPPRAVAQWRAITLTLLSKREPFMQQRAQDTEAVVHEIYSTLSTLLSPPSHLQQQIQASLRNVMRLAVELSIEMRTQRAEYIMLPPLQPEYDIHGDLVAKVTFNASLMNERSGETTSNDELEARGAIVKVVLFPLVVKKGDDFGEGEDEIVVCPAQVLIAKPNKKKVVRVMSGAMSMHSRASSKGRSAVSLAPESSVMDLDDSNMI
ncbi:uncharacterized protein EKO05_0000118 [Ascochyta rabiei]|uniref:uncharacterized protein n=1 Tax=Didymella rabiei TaxID=5454 RepID=UPI0021F984A7|nr:uncharacterized protein EKO05_0000118 [Ascochyta rabiei]UPX09429.1 hypothetical protein EKO05_0000118 [Ascochyta rabiei]